MCFLQSIVSKHTNNEKALLKDKIYKQYTDIKDTV